MLYAALGEVGVFWLLGLNLLIIVGVYGFFSLLGISKNNNYYYIIIIILN